MTSRIYFINDDPDVNVQEYRDDDVIGSPIDIGQILAAIWQRHSKKAQPMPIAGLDGDYWLAWAEKSKENYTALWNLGMDLLDEHFHRFGSRISPNYKHGMWRIINEMAAVPPLPDLPGDEPDYDAMLKDYVADKSRPHKWTGRPIPSWWGNHG